VVSNVRRGKAPSIEPFTGEGVDILFEEWPTFEWMTIWNNWSESGKLLQLASHLRAKPGKNRLYWKQMINYLIIKSLKNKLGRHWLFKISEIRWLDISFATWNKPSTGNMGMIRFVKRVTAHLLVHSQLHAGGPEI